MLAHIKKMASWYIGAIFLIACDRYLKYLAISGSFDEGIGLISDWFKLSFAANENIAFSLPLTGQILITIIILIIVGLTCLYAYYARRGANWPGFLIFSVMLGSMSNLLDRLEHGYVIDYLDLKYFTVFNLADTMIVLGVLTILWMNNKKEPGGQAWL